MRNCGATANTIEFKSGYYRSDDGGQTWPRIADEAPTEMQQGPGRKST
jgi:photosystem II stability/assembly factor-like uncharacterized protein